MKNAFILRDMNLFFNIISSFFYAFNHHSSGSTSRVIVVSMSGDHSGVKGFDSKGLTSGLVLNYTKPVQKIFTNEFDSQYIYIYI